MQNTQSSQNVSPKNAANALPLSSAQAANASLSTASAGAPENATSAAARTSRAPFAPGETFDFSRYLVIGPENLPAAVSYTHLTLPTILLV